MHNIQRHTHTERDTHTLGEGDTHTGRGRHTLRYTHTPRDIHILRKTYTEHTGTDTLRETHKH